MTNLGTTTLTLNLSPSSPSLMSIVFRTFHVSYMHEIEGELQNRRWNRFSELAQLKSISVRIRSPTPAPSPLWPFQSSFNSIRCGTGRREAISDKLLKSMPFAHPTPPRVRKGSSEKLSFFSLFLSFWNLFLCGNRNAPPSTPPPVGLDILTVCYCFTIVSLDLFGVKFCVGIILTITIVYIAKVSIFIAIFTLTSILMFGSPALFASSSSSSSSS